MEDVMMVMGEGEKNRTVACTKMNTNRWRGRQARLLQDPIGVPCTAIHSLQFTLPPAVHAVCGGLQQGLQGNKPWPSYPGGPGRVWEDLPQRGHRHSTSGGSCNQQVLVSTWAGRVREACNTRGLIIGNCLSAYQFQVMILFYHTSIAFVVLNPVTCAHWEELNLYVYRLYVPSSYRYLPQFAMGLSIFHTATQN